MDHNDPSRLQYTYSAESQQQQEHQQTQTQQQHAQYQAPVTPSSGAQSAYTPQQQLSSSQGIVRASPNNPQLYGFAQGLQYGAPQQYGQEYIGHDSRPQQRFGQYVSDLAYGMQQTQSQHTRQSSFGQMQQYRPRDGATLGTMSGPFAEPQAAQYYAGAQPASAAVTQPGFESAQMVTHYQPATYAPTVAAAPPSFPGAMLEPVHQTAYQAFGQQQPSLHTPHLGHQLHQNQVEQAFGRYQTNIRTVFTLVRARTLRDAAQPLLDASRYLLGSVEALGLTRDEEGQHDERLSLWDEYNRAWLSTMQCQFDMTQELFAGRQLHASQSTLDHDTLEALARELLRLCDGIEKFGLVDYEMGVQEDEIIEIILRCLSQLESMSDDVDEAEVMEQ